MKRLTCSVLFLLLAPWLAHPLQAAETAAPAINPFCKVTVSAQADGKHLPAFANEAELDRLVKCLSDAARKQREAQKKAWHGSTHIKGYGSMLSTKAMPAPAAISAAKMETASTQESITNTQTVGVDEGGIVKVHGNHLVVLRRGRLFTIAIDGGKLKPVAAIDAFAPDASPSGAWYDEMLIDGDTVVVIGYSYQRGGTEIGLFNVTASGQLSYRATYHLRSNDYYSSRNYASRLVGHKLVFYTPLQLNWSATDPYASFPAVRRWNPKATPADFKRIAQATHIYRTDDDYDSSAPLALHSVTSCDLSQPEMACEATAVMGPAGRVFYVSANSVYVWTNNPRRTQNRNTQGNHTPASAVFRIPLDGSAPSAIKTAGAPIDQFSFLESDDDHLNVLLRAQGQGDAMWSAEHSAGSTALLRLPLALLGNGRESAPASAYHALHDPEGGTVQNRFIGNYLLYGNGNSWNRPKEIQSPLKVLRWDQPNAIYTVPLPHSVDRIEALGHDAVVVGTAGSTLQFSSVRLDTRPVIVSSYTQDHAAQGETRSHGFFYKPTGPGQGLLGLPIAGSGRPGHRQLRDPSAAVLFLQNRHLKLDELGTLSASAGIDRINDDCHASCVDWYGNSRPLFLRNRVFALMGYELVEGRIGGGNRIRETRRINFAPQKLEVAR